jgi:DNA-binding transcriptional LysR family regulator
LLADLDETEASVSGEARYARGRLRLTAPIALSVLRLAPALAAFSQAYPEITLDIVLSDNVADFTEEGLDLAIALGAWAVRTSSPGRSAKPRCWSPPRRLSGAPTPQTPDELGRHVLYLRFFSDRQPLGVGKCRW